MDLTRARRWVILASLVATGVVFGFFLLAPLVGYPLEFSQSLKLVELILPVFLGYLGSATHFIFSQHQRKYESLPHPELFSLLVRGPIFVFAVGAASALTAFGWTNRLSAPPGVGMSAEMLGTFFSLLLGLLAVTTSTLTAYLFAVEQHPNVPAQP